MLTQMPSSYHSSEDIHKQTNIDEVSSKPNVSNVANPDLIASRDLKVLKSVAPGTHPLKRFRGLTDTFDGNREVGGFHQSGNASIPNGVSHAYQQLCDTPISIGRIPQCQLLYFIAEDGFRRVPFRLIVETTLVKTEGLANLSHGILRSQRLNEASLFR